MPGDLLIGEAVARGYPPAVLYLRNDETVTTEVSAFNYFSVFMKDHPEVDAHVWFFDGAGTPAGYFHRELGVNGQLQLQTSDLCPRVSGTVAMALVPKHETKLRPGRKVTTGYYAQYFSQHGAVTLSHEREPVAASPFPTSAWMQSYLTRFLKESGVVLVNSCMASEGASVGTARLMALDGTELGQRAGPFPRGRKADRRGRRFCPRVQRHQHRQSVQLLRVCQRQVQLASFLKGASVTRFPSSPWKPYEPRFMFPTFAGVESRMGFSIPAWYRPIDTRYLRSLVAGSLRKNFRETVKDLVPELASLVASGFSKKLKFKLHILSRDGEYRATYEFPRDYAPGASVEIELSRLFASLKLPQDDYLVIAVMSRGRMDGFRSSPASYSMTYVDQDNVAIYRTGAFARPLNEGRLKAHVGFTGINPKIIATSDIVSSVLLINHSSDPEYAHSAQPTTRLIREDGEELEADFGEIPPLGAREMSVVDMFGPRVFDFLKPFSGRGSTVTTCAGVTLASLHLQRTNDNRRTLLGIEHSRPAHMNLAGILQH